MDLHLASQESHSQRAEVRGAVRTGELVEAAMVVGEGIGQVGDVVIPILNGVLKVVPGHGVRLVVAATQVALNSICLQPSMLSVTNNHIVFSLFWRGSDVGDVCRILVLMRCNVC